MKQNNDFLIFALFSLLAVGVWTGFGVYRAFLKPPPVKVSADDLLPIDPTFGTDFIDKLEKRREFSEEEISKFRTENGLPIEETNLESKNKSVDSSPSNSTGSGEVVL